MATPKKGSINFVKNNYCKVQYVHRGADLDKMGAKLVKFLRSHTVEELDKLYDSLILVDEDDPMTAEQKEAYKKYIPEQLWSEDLTWTKALAYTKNALKPIEDGFPYIVDYAGFLPTWTNRYRYMIDLDRNLFQITKGGLECIGADDNYTWNPDSYPDSIAPLVLGQFRLDDVPEDAIEQCKANFRTYVLKYVPTYFDMEEANRWEDDAEAQHDAKKMAYFIGIK